MLFPTPLPSMSNILLLSVNYLLTKGCRTCSSLMLDGLDMCIIFPFLELETSTQ
uniref:Uncharacterized protein n=1 Tax=Rhizophora mucronata TaxID=61149 RepID=A0A2P2PXE1_RHIMU